MDLSYTQKKNIRKNFGKLIEGLAIPNLIEVQKNSYSEFLSSKSIHEVNDELTKGIHKTFKSCKDFNIEISNTFRFKINNKIMNIFFCRSKIKFLMIHDLIYLKYPKV